MRRVGHDMKPSEVQEFVTARCPTILEIGCNDGTDTNRLLQVFPTARIYCFEPDPRAIKRFEETVHNDRVTLFELAISERDGTATFNGSSGRPPKRQPGASHYCSLDEWDLSGSLCKPTGHLTYSPWVTFPENRRFLVNTMRLDSWASLVLPKGTIDFIWADVQGAEAMMIKGGPETFARARFLYTEFYNQEMYEGQPNLDGILALLPTFKIAVLYGRTNVLLQQEVK